MKTIGHVKSMNTDKKYLVGLSADGCLGVKISFNEWMIIGENVKNIRYALSLAISYIHFQDLLF